MIQTYVERIRQLDQGLNSVRIFDEHAPDGLNILVKDNIDVAGYTTTAGSVALSDNLAIADSPCIAALRKNGAVIFGKTNMTEFANYFSKGLPSGYSSLSGQVICAYDEKENPWGSSTGSAVAVSAGLCDAAIGTDTSNSIVGAALRNGVCGYKPPIHTLSQQGIVPIAFTLDSAGPMARTVRLTVDVYQMMRETPLAISQRDLKDMRFAVNTANAYYLSQDERQAHRELVERLRQSGARVTEVEVLHNDAISTLMKYEIKAAMNHYLQTANSAMSTLSDILAFNDAHPEHIPYGQTLLLAAQNEASGNMDEAAYQAALKTRQEQRTQCLEELKEYDGVLLMGPNSIQHFVGFPSISLPDGILPSGMPAGVTVFGVEEARLLCAALALEEKRITRGYIAPKRLFGDK